MPKTTSLMIRKSIHFITGFLILLLTYLADREILLLLLIAGAIFSLFTFNYRRLRILHRTAGSSLGTLFYPAGIISSFLILYNYPLNFFRAALLLLTISDTAAYWAGQIPCFNKNFRVLGDKKSLLGVIAFSASSIIVICFISPPGCASGISYLLLSLVIAVNMEVISFRGSDNLTIPLGMALFFHIYINHQINTELILAIILIMSAGSFLLFRLKILDRKGSIAAYLLGIYFAGILGPTWFLPVLLFFVSSVILTHLNTRFHKKERSLNTRNIWQVTANIFWATGSSVLFLISGHEIFIMFFIALVAAVTADTWASELGPLLNRKSYSLKDHKFYPAGITGGISPGGTLAALTSSVIVSAISYYLFFGSFQFTEIILLSLSGFFACFSDSLLGAFAEDKLTKLSLFRNNPGMPDANDVVNLLGSFTAPVFFLVMKVIV